MTSKEEIKKLNKYLYDLDLYIWGKVLWGKDYKSKKPKYPFKKPSKCLTKEV